MSLPSVLRQSSSLERLFYPLAILATIGALVYVQRELSIEFVLFGLYAVFGLIGGAVIYYGRTAASHPFTLDINKQAHKTGVYITSAVTVALVALTNEPLVVALGLLVGYTLIVRQLFTHDDSMAILPQLVALYLLSPITKYLTSGIYIGHGDILPHTRLTEAILSGGSVAAITGTTYFDFPGLHLLATTVSSLSGLSAYDGLMLSGLVAYSLLIPAVYVVAMRITDNKEFALMTALAVVIIDDLSFYASYVFPQSLATVMIVVLAVLACLVDRDSIKWPVTAAFGIILAALILTHHLTHVLFLPLFGVVGVLYAVQGKQYAKSLLLSRQMALFVVAEIVILARLLQTGFFSRILEAAALLLQGGAYGGYTQSVTLWLGDSEPHPVLSALGWLVSPYSIYLMLLLMVFSLGIVVLLRDRDLSPRFTAVAWAGLLGAILVFETPISLKSMIRIRMPWLFVFAVVLAVGLWQLRRYVGSDRSSKIFFAAIVLLAAMGPLVTADNYYNLDPRSSSPTSFSDEEYSELRAASAFIDSEETPTTVFWETRLVMERYGVSGLERPEIRDQSVVLPPGYFVYRSNWPENEVSFTTTSDESLYAHSIFLSDAWLTDRVNAENKVYSAGGTGILWSEDERTLANDE